MYYTEIVSILNRFADRMNFEKGTHRKKENDMDRVKRIWFLSPMRAAKVQASLRIRASSAEPSLLAHTSSESRGTFRQKARSLAPLNGWACAVKICHNGMLEDTNSLDGAHTDSNIQTIPDWVLFRILIQTVIGYVMMSPHHPPSWSFFRTDRECTRAMKMLSTLWQSTGRRHATLQISYSEHSLMIGHNIKVCFIPHLHFWSSNTHKLKQGQVMGPLCLLRSCTF